MELMNTATKSRVQNKKRVFSRKMVKREDEDSLSEEFPRIEPPPGGHYRVASAAFVLRKEGARTFLVPDTSKRKFIISIIVGVTIVIILFAGGSYAIHTLAEGDNKGLGISLLGLACFIAGAGIVGVTVADREHRQRQGPLIIRDEEKGLYYFPWMGLTERLDSVVNFHHVIGDFRISSRETGRVDQLFYEVEKDGQRSFGCFFMGCPVNRKKLDSMLREGFFLSLTSHRLSRDEAVEIKSRSNIR